MKAKLFYGEGNTEPAIVEIEKLPEILIYQDTRFNPSCRIFVCAGGGGCDQDGVYGVYCEERSHGTFFGDLFKDAKPHTI